MPSNRRIEGNIVEIVHEEALSEFCFQYDHPKDLFLIKIVFKFTNLLEL
jgi:hypothetical protein